MKKGTENNAKTALWTKLRKVAGSICYESQNENRVPW